MATHDPRAAQPVSDLDLALSAVEGDRELLGRMVRLFLSQTPDLLADIRAAVASGDRTALEQATHKLRGAAVNFGAGRACEAALRLEDMARSGDLTRAGDACGDLEHAVFELRDALMELSEQRAS